MINKPKALDYYLSITGYSERDLEKIVSKHRTGKAKNLPDPSKMKKNIFETNKSINELMDNEKKYNFGKKN